MKPPFVLECEGLIDVKETLEDLKLAVEPEDIEEGTCSAYDSDGRRLILSTRRNQESRFFPYKEVVVSAERDPSHLDELRAKLVRWLLRDGGSAESLSTLALPELITRARMCGT